MYLFRKPGLIHLGYKNTFLFWWKKYLQDLSFEINRYD